MHLKRQKSPSKWPIERKGTTYLVRSISSSTLGIPMIIILRDILKLAQNRKEVKEAIRSKKILINGKQAMDDKRGILLFDTMSVPSIGKFYRLSVTMGGKFCLEEIKESEASRKISKITNKKILKGKKTQLNLIDGRNFLSEIKCRVNDSVVIDLKKGSIEKCLPLGEKSRAFVFEGKHSGKNGMVTKIDGKKRMVEIDDGKKRINVLIKQIMVTG